VAESELKNHWFHLFGELQRNVGFHEIIGKEPVVSSLII
jgi:hypothetical protein